jgi:hypothetical protein
VTELAGEGANATAQFKDWSVHCSLTDPRQENAAFMRPQNAAHAVKVGKATFQVVKFLQVAVSAATVIRLQIAHEL